MFKLDVYKNRRFRLKEKMGSGLVLILGNQEAPANYKDNCYRFRQDSSFLYLFGLNLPSLAGVIDIDSGEEYIFGDDVTMDDIIWMGPKPKVFELAARVGVQNSAPLVKLADYLRVAIAKGRKVHFLPPYRSANKILLQDLLGINPSLIKNFSSLELIHAVITMRSVKETCEIEEIEKACDIGYEMHTTVMKECKEGVVEQLIAGQIEGVACSYGSMISFPVILSQHGETLHNHYHDKVLKNGNLLLTDAGAENNMNYCSDFTRTIPVSGKFDARQKDVYESVLSAHDVTLLYAKPEVTYKSVHLEACKALATGLKNVGVMKGNIDDAVAAGAHALFMPHGLGHMMGLDVHDMEDFDQKYVGYDDEVRPSTQFGLDALRMGRRLKEGFVITDEPGCYFIPALIDQWRAEGLHKDFFNYDKIETYKDFGGIRIEDDVVITPTGSRFLGEKRIPSTVADIEEFMRNN